MSNPCINRWGKNLFWYKNWYTDKNYALTLHQDKIFTKLISIYLTYGILHPVNIFTSKRWHFTQITNLQDFRNEHTTRYYRAMHFKDLVNDTESTYFVRIKTKDIYETRIWLFRYQNWIIFSFYFFQPQKGLNYKRRKKVVRSKDFNHYFLDNSKDNFALKRLKFITYYFLKNARLSKLHYYLF